MTGRGIRRLAGGTAIVAIAILTGVGIWHTSRPVPTSAHVLARRPRGVMGTSCLLVAIAEARESGEQALREAEGALRHVEARMSTWLEDSEISRLNRAAAGTELALSSETAEVLAAARQAALDSEGAFDVTCGPLVDLWRSAGERGARPGEAELEEARALSSWDHIELTDSGAVKRTAEARVDLGGIAKGFGIDSAVEVLAASDVLGGLVDVGGDLRCLGAGPEEGSWQVEIRNPFGGGPLAHLRLGDAAVCTSGNYARFVEIEGLRYSHIIDPRSGRPAGAVASATVVAPQAMTADIWATALSVLADDGLDMLPAGVDALLVLGSADDFQIVCTQGLRSMIEEPVPAGLLVVGGPGRGD